MRYEPLCLGGVFWPRMSSVPFLLDFQLRSVNSDKPIWLISLGSKCIVSDIPVDQVDIIIVEKVRSSKRSRCIEVGPNLNGQKRSKNTVSMRSKNAVID